MNASLSPQFLSFANVTIEKSIVALIMTFININTEIDLSVGSMMGLSACAVGVLVQQGVPGGWAILICLYIGILGGALNGWFIARIGLPSLVITLTTLIGFRGLASQCLPYE